MRFLAPIFAFFSIAFIALVAFAQASLPVDLSTLSDAEAFDYLLKGLGGMKGAGALPIAYFVTQVVLFVFRFPFANLLGKWKLLVVGLVTLVSTALFGKLLGMTWTTVLMSAPVLTAFQVLVDQVKQHLPEKAKAPA